MIIKNFINGQITTGTEPIDPISGVSRGLYINSVLSGNSSSDTLVGLDINPSYSGIAGNYFGLRVSGDTIFATSGGTQVFRTFNNGSVIIGSGTTQSSYQLDVNGTGRFSNQRADDNFIFTLNRSVNTVGVSPRLRWTGNNVGSIDIYGEQNFFTVSASAGVSASSYQGNFINFATNTGTVSEPLIRGGNGYTGGLFFIGGGGVTGNAGIGFSIGNYTEGMRLVSTGNLLIGTTTDAGQRLQVNGSTRLIGGGSTSGTTGFTVVNSSNEVALQVLDNKWIGMQVLSPSAPLHVYYPGTTPQTKTIAIFDGYQSPAQPLMQIQVGREASNLGVFLGYDMPNSNGFIKQIGASSNALSWNDLSNVAIGGNATQNNSLTIYGRSYGSATSFNTTGIMFRTASGTLTVISNSTAIPDISVVGLGTQTISSNVIGRDYGNVSNLYIDGPPRAGSSTTFVNAWSMYVNSGNTYFGGRVMVGLTGDTGFQFTSSGSTLLRGSGTTSASYALAIQNSSGGTTMVVNNAGNMLIGTTTDAGYRLDVNGDVRTGNLTVGASGQGQIIAGQFDFYYPNTLRYQSAYYFTIVPHTAGTTQSTGGYVAIKADTIQLLHDNYFSIASGTLVNSGDSVKLKRGTNLGHLPLYLSIEGADAAGYNYGTRSGSVLIYPGEQSFDNGYGSVVLAHNGINERGSVLIGTSTTNNSRLLVGGTVSGATLSTTRAVHINPTLLATGNTTTLIGLDIQPRYSIGSYTGLTQLALRVSGDSSITNNLVVGGSSITNTLLAGGTSFLTHNTNPVYSIQSQNNIMLMSSSSTNKFNLITTDPATFWTGRLDGAWGPSTILGVSTGNTSYNGIISTPLTSYFNFESTGTIAAQTRLATKGTVTLDGSTNRFIRFWEPGVAYRAVIGHTDTADGGHIVIRTGDATTLSDGTQALRIFQSTQNVFVGSSTTDLGFKLSVSGSTLLRGSGTTSASYALATQNSSGGTTMVVNNAGNMLIGTTTDAGYRLDVNGTTRLGNLTLANGGILLGDVGGTRVFNTAGLAIDYGALYPFSITGSGTITITPAGILTLKGVTHTYSATETYVVQKTTHIGHLQINFDISGSDAAAYNYGTISGNVRIYPGEQSNGNGYGNVILAHNGINERGSVLIGTSTTNNSRLLVGGTVSGATLSTTRAVHINPTLLATGNTTTLIGLDIQPRYSIGSYTGLTQIALRVSGGTQIIGSGSTGTTLSLFSVDGASGRLFDVTDDFTNSLFSVNTSSGVPVIEAFANNSIVMGTYGSNALVVSGTSVSVGTNQNLARLFVKSSGTSTSNAFVVQNSSGGTISHMYDNGSATFGTSSNGGFKYRFVDENNLGFQITNGDAGGSTGRGTLIIGESSANGRLVITTNTSIDTANIGYTYGGVISFSTGGTERMRLARNASNLLINTTTDSGHNLNVNGTSNFSGNMTLGGTATLGSTVIGNSGIAIGDGSNRGTWTVGVGYAVDMSNVAQSLGVGSVVPWMNNSISLGAGGYADSTSSQMIMVPMAMSATTMSSGSTAELYISNNSQSRLSIPNLSVINAMVTVDYIATCTLTGSSSSLVFNDVKAGTQKFYVKRWFINNVGAYFTISTPVDVYSQSDSAMSGATLSYEYVSASTFKVKFNAPPTANGSTFRCAATVRVTTYKD